MNRALLFGLAIVVILVGVWQLWLFPSRAIRYRLTVDVAVADEVRTGSGVIETVWHDQWLDIPFARIGEPWGVDVRGEAITVDLGAPGTLFVLLAYDPTRSSRQAEFASTDPSSLVVAAMSNYRVAGPGSATRELLSEIENRPDVVEVTPASLPMLVRFRDINDPKTIERVEPGDLAASFGPRAALKKVTMQIVPSGYWPFNRLELRGPQWIFGEPLTKGVEHKLPWLGTIPAYISGKRVVDNDRPERNITSSAFRAGIQQ